MSDKVGYRVFTKVDRPDPALIERFRNIPTSNINDMMNRLYCMNGSIHQMNGHNLLGTAITVKAPIGDNLVFHRALDVAQPGDVLIVDGGGCCDRSLAGEIMMTYAAAKGLAGIVVDGALRDLDGIRNCPMPVYCKAITPQGPYKNGPGEINVPVCCGGVAVLPGDIIVGDCDGIVVIRPKDAPFVIEKAEKKLAAEEKKLADYRAIGIDEEIHSAAYEKKMAEAGALVIND